MAVGRKKFSIGCRAAIYYVGVLMDGLGVCGASVHHVGVRGTSIYSVKGGGDMLSIWAERQIEK
jgi:hypothetical protein